MIGVWGWRGPSRQSPRDAPRSRGRRRNRRVKSPVGFRPRRRRRLLGERALAATERSRRAWVIVSSLRVLFVLRRAISRRLRVRLAHVRALLRVAVVMRARQVIDAGIVVDPNHVDN